MNTQCIRFQELELRRFKNTTDGTISMPSVINKDLFEYKSDILGIYGQNGTGKSSIIEAMYLLTELLSQKELAANYSRYITKGEKSCEIRAHFLLEIKDRLKAFLEYTIVLNRAEPKKENSCDAADSASTFISYECLRYKKWIAEKGKFSRVTELLSFDANTPKVLNTSKIQKLLIEQHPENQIEIALAIAAAQNQRRSVITSPQLQELLRGIDSPHMDDMRRIVAALQQYARRDAIVVVNEQLCMSNVAVPFHIRQMHQDYCTSGRIPIPLNGTVLLPEVFYTLLKKPICHINKVLESLIPELQIELRNLGKEIDKEGKTSIRAQLLSHRGDVVIPLQCESAGIIKIVSILSALLHVFHHASVCLVVDELDAGIFEYLLGEILKTLDMHAQGQIIFTSHNLRALEMLRKESLMFSTTNPEKRYIRMKNVKATNNLRDQYYRAIQLGGQSEELYAETDSAETARAFRQAIIEWEE